MVFSAGAGGDAQLPFEELDEIGGGLETGFPGHGGDREIRGNQKLPGHSESAGQNVLVEGLSDGLFHKLAQIIGMVVEGCGNCVVVQLRVTAIFLDVGKNWRNSLSVCVPIGSQKQFQKGKLQKSGCGFPVKGPCLQKGIGDPAQRRLQVREVLGENPGKLRRKFVAHKPCRVKIVRCGGAQRSTEGTEFAGQIEIDYHQRKTAAALVQGKAVPGPRREIQCRSPLERIPSLVDGYSAGAFTEEKQTAIVADAVKGLMLENVVDSGIADIGIHLCQGHMGHLCFVIFFLGIVIHYTTKMLYYQDMNQNRRDVL